MSELVVVGVDGSPASYTALRWALEYPGRTGARVHAVRCWLRSWSEGGKPQSPASRRRHTPSNKPPPAMATRRTLTPVTAEVPA